MRRAIWGLAVGDGFFGRGRVASIIGVMAMVAAVLPAGVAVDAAGAATVPSVPRNLTAVAGPKTGQMTLKWKAPASSGGSIITGYQVETKADAGAFGAPQALPKKVKAVLACSGVTSCDFRVAAVNGVGTGPATAAVTSPWLAPHAPKLKTVVGGPTVGQMTVKWAPPADNGGKAITGWLYDVRVDNTGAWVGPLPMTGVGGGAKSTLLPCSSTTPSGGCAYRVYAQNAIGTSPVSNSVNGAWKIPKAVKISDVVPGRPVASATISWTATADTGGLAVTYRYQVSSDGGPFVNGASTLGTFPRTAIVECPGTNNCSYKVFAQNAKGSSAASPARDHRVQPPGQGRDAGRRRGQCRRPEPRLGHRDRDRHLVPVTEHGRRADDRLRRPDVHRQLHGQRRRLGLGAGRPARDERHLVDHLPGR